MIKDNIINSQRKITDLQTKYSEGNRLKCLTSLNDVLTATETYFTELLITLSYINEDTLQALNSIAEEKLFSDDDKDHATKAIQETNDFVSGLQAQMSDLMKEFVEYIKVDYTKSLDSFFEMLNKASMVLTEQQEKSVLEYLNDNVIVLLKEVQSHTDNLVINKLKTTITKCRMESYSVLCKYLNIQLYVSYNSKEELNAELMTEKINGFIENLDQLVKLGKDENLRNSLNEEIAELKVVVGSVCEALKEVTKQLLTKIAE